MTTSLNRIKAIEDFLSGTLSTEDRLLFHAKLLLDHLLKKDVIAQRHVHDAIRLHGREMRKREMEEIHRRIFGSPDQCEFRKEIMEIFSNH
jgi:hypothetical protein